MGHYYVYILSSRSGVLYIGMTNDLERRVVEHKEKVIEGFTARYNVNRLVYYEEFDTPSEAIAAEKKLKGWRRAKKVALIEQDNPQWKDLSEDWFEQRTNAKEAHNGVPNLPRPSSPNLSS